MASVKKPKTKLAESSCDVFELSPVVSNLNSYYKEVKVDFFGSPEKSKVSSLSKYRWPKYNNDGLFFTPAFVIPEDLPVLSLVKDSLKNDYMHRMSTNDEPETKDTLASLVLPQPQEQSHCGVCKTNYSCFQEHVDSISHKENCKKSKYTKHIYEFCDQLFKNDTPKQQKSSSIQQFPACQVVRKSEHFREHFPNASNHSQHDFPQNSESYQDQLFEEFNTPMDIRNMDLTPPVKRRRFF